MIEADDLAGKVAIVTGSSSGIGRALAVALAQQGMRVVVNGRAQERLEGVAEEIKRDGAPNKSAAEKLFEARDVERDASFLRRYLTEDLMREMDLFQYEPRGEDLVISKVADEEGWKTVKEQLIRNIGTATIPVIKIEDADFGQNRTLYVRHYHDGRDLHLEYAEKTLGYLYRLWGRECILETSIQSKRSLLCFNDRGFSAKALK